MNIPADMVGQPSVVRLFDARGALAWEQKLAAGVQDIVLLDRLPAGVYHLQLIQNQQTTTRKMMISVTN
jgi:hypothetical protein